MSIDAKKEPPEILSLPKNEIKYIIQLAHVKYCSYIENLFNII